MKKRIFAMILVMMLFLTSMPKDVFAEEIVQDKASEEQVLTKELKDGITVEVAKAPEDAKLLVEEASKKVYDEALQKECGSDYEVVMALDISVKTKDDNALKDKVKVSVKSDDLKKIPEGAVLYHIKDDKAKSVKFTQDEKKGIIEFQTKKFSPFVLIVPAEKKEDTKKEETSEKKENEEVKEEKAEVKEEAPVAEVKEEAPAAEVKEEAPVVEVKKEAPKAEVKEEAPKTEIKEEPAPETAPAEITEEPAKREEAVTEEPAKKEEAVTEEPAKKEEAVTEETVKKEEAVTEEPAKKEEAVTEEPAKREEAVTEEPAKKEETEKPTDTKEETEEIKVTPVDVQFSGKITLNGRDLKAQEFGFVLAGSNKATEGITETVKNTADGKFTFSKLTYKKAGTYTYTVKQEETTAGGVTGDENIYTIKVTVTDDGRGKLEAKISGDTKTGKDVNFKATYKPAPVKVQFGGHKTLKGFPDGSKIVPKFTMKLMEDGSEIDSKTVQKQGDYIFKKITYKKEGTHTYTIKEKAGKQAGITYDNMVYTIKVTVTDNKEGQLVAKITGDSKTGKDLNFKNTYKPEPVTVRFGGTKTLAGKKLVADEFLFNLSGSNDLDKTVKNDADGKILFPKLTFKKAGVYNYTVKEVYNKEAGIIIDSKTYKITVTVTDDGSGKLAAAISGDTKTGKDLDFKNTYKTGSLTIAKTVTGDLGDKSKYFTFTVTLGIDGRFAYTGSKTGNIASGESIKLKHGESITITGIPVGITYQVVESDNQDYKVTKDGDSGTILLSGDTKASFTNTRSSVPKTGDDRNLSMWIGLMLASLLLIGGTVLYGKKRK